VKGERAEPDENATPKRVDAMGMKATDVLKHIDWTQLTKAEKAALRKKLLAQKEQQMKVLEAIEKALNETAIETKNKPPAKGKTETSKR
jgi:hypothetical protein